MSISQEFEELIKPFKEEEKIAKIVNFWKSKNYIKSKEDEPLAILLSNTTSANVATSFKEDTQFVLDVLANWWYKDITKHIVTWNVMSAPTQLIYFLQKNETQVTDLTLQSETVVAKTRRTNGNYVLSDQDTRKYVTLTPETFERNEITVNNWYKHIDRNKLIDIASSKITRDLTKEILLDVSNNVDAIDVPIGKIKETIFNTFGVMPKSLATGELGIEILQNVYGVKLNYSKNDSCEAGVVDGIKVFYTPDIEDEIIVSSQKGFESNFFFCPYLICPTPERNKGNSFLMRYDKKLAPNKSSGYLVKINL